MLLLPMHLVSHDGALNRSLVLESGSIFVIGTGHVYKWVLSLNVVAVLSSALNAAKRVLESSAEQGERHLIGDCVLNL